MPTKKKSKAKTTKPSSDILTPQSTVEPEFFVNDIRSADSWESVVLILCDALQVPSSCAPGRFSEKSLTC